LGLGFGLGLGLAFEVEVRVIRGLRATRVDGERLGAEIRQDLGGEPG